MMSLEKGNVKNWDSLIKDFLKIQASKKNNEELKTIQQKIWENEAREESGLSIVAAFASF